MLAFDEAEHRYYWNGIRVPNVTSILAPLTDYSHVEPAALEKARAEGVAIHKMVENHAKGVEQLIPDWMAGHHTAMLQFFADTGFQCWISEHKVYHHGLKYAGTLDLYGETPLLKDARGNVLIDVKRSLYAGPAIGIQLAAYNAALRSGREYPAASRRYALVLRANGTYRLEPFTDLADEAVFTALLTLQRWKEKHGRA